MDPRARLLPHRDAPSLYLHACAGADQADRVAGPFASADELARVPGVDPARVPRLEGLQAGEILRVDLDEVALDRAAVLRHVEFVPYELPDAEEQGRITRQREEVDRGLGAADLADAPAALLARAQREFGTIVDGLFRHGLCSMTRIVLSGRWREWPEWVAVTARDREKRPGVLPQVALLREGGPGQLVAHGGEAAVASSSARVVWEYHRLRPADVLVHAHLVVPVLFGREAECLPVITATPRTAGFGRALVELLGRSPWVLRRNEGIWCHGGSAEQALQSALSCQARTLGMLLSEGAPS